MRGLWLFLVLGALVLLGCGGGGAGREATAGSGPVPSSKGSGRLKVAIPWPAASRSALTSARSARVVASWSNDSAEQVVESSESTVEFDGVPAGPVAVRVDTFHGDDAQGVRTGHAEGSGVVVEDSTTELSLQLSRVDLPIATTRTLEFEPNKSRYAREEFLTAVAKVKPSDGFTLLPTNFRVWLTWDGGTGSATTVTSDDNGEVRLRVLIPKDPNKDNVYVNVSMSGNGDYSFSAIRKRIPIGL